MKNKIVVLILLNIVFLGGISAQCRIDSVVNYNYISKTSAKEPGYYYKNFYDNKDSLTGMIYKSWNNITNQYVNTAQEDYILNSNGKRTRINYKNWMYNSWKNDAQVDITLDGNGNESVFLNKTWDSASNTYLTTSRYFIVFNSKNKPTQSLQQFWDNTNSVWINSSKSDLTYDAGNLFVINQTTTKWNTDSNKWVNYYKLDYNFKSPGQARSRVFYYWMCNTGCYWDLSDSTVYNYNNSGNDTVNYRHYLGQIIQKMESGYNPDGCVQIQKYFSWDNTDSKFYADAEYIYTYRQKSSDIEAVVQKEIEIYPNPASDKLTIKNAEASAYAIRDILSGKQILKGTMENGSVQIDVSDISNGLYILTLDQTTYKLIINH